MGGLAPPSHRGPSAGFGPRSGRLTTRRRSALIIAIVVVIACGAAACASPTSGGYHTVARGENLYRIGLRYGVDAATLAKVNGIDDVTTLSVGQRIWIPDGSSTGGSVRSSGGSGSMRSQGVNPAAAARARNDARREATREGDLSFDWPVQNARVSSSFGRRKRGPHEGIDLRADKGTRIWAAESGKVIHSGWLGDYGRVVIIKHAGPYRSVYAHASRLFVRRGDFVDRGQLIAEVGSTGNATGPHLHFEIRRNESPKDPMLYLP
jgi:murein DD-endopeptidase MepM/ murein hydrolase activator NlpD